MTKAQKAKQENSKNLFNRLEKIKWKKILYFYLPKCFLSVLLLSVIGVAISLIIFGSGKFSFIHYISTPLFIIGNIVTILWIVFQWKNVDNLILKESFKFKDYMKIINVVVVALIGIVVWTISGYYIFTDLVW